MDEVREKQKQRLRSIQTKKDFHGWISKQLSNHDVHNFYCKNCNNQSIVEVSLITDTYECPYTYDTAYIYKGIVHEYQGPCIRYKNISTIQTVSEIF